jgi:PAS domain S-box-containing protein
MRKEAVWRGFHRRKRAPFHGVPVHATPLVVRLHINGRVSAIPKVPRVHNRARTEPGQHRKVVQLAQELSATLGSDFFQSMVRHVAAAFHADCVWIAELYGMPPDRLRTLAAFRSSGGANHFEQSLSGTAAGQALADGVVACARDAWQLFPKDDLIVSNHAEGYLAVRLSKSGEPLGVLGMMCKKGFTNLPLLRSVLDAFVGRTACELQRKRDEDLRRQNEERYHAFVSTNPDAMWRLELEKPVPLSLPEEEQIDMIYRFGYVAECNDAAARNAGLQRAEDMVGARIKDLAPPRDAKIMQDFRTALRSRFRLTTMDMQPTGHGGHPTYRLRSYFGIVDDKDALRRIWFTTRDITDLRRAEMSLAASESRFRTVLEGIQLPAVILDSDGTATFANECFLRLARRPDEDVMKRKWLEGIVPAEEREEWQATLAPDERGRFAAVHFEGTLLPRGATPLTIAWDTIALGGADGGVSGLAAIGRDITREEALETDVRQAQKLESVGRLAAGIAHDFNNLLTVILGRSGQLLLSAKEGSTERESLSEIERAATQCACLTGELLAFSRKQHLRPKLTNLNEVIAADERIIHTLAGDKIQIVLNLASSLGPVCVDAVQIQRAVANLVTNARDAMPDGGILSITTSPMAVSPDDLALAAVPPGNYIRLSVSDTGVGVTDEIRAHLFEPFFTTKPMGRGTGLGLATVYGIVTQSGGHINVFSEPGKGTRFDLMFPAAREP